MTKTYSVTVWAPAEESVTLGMQTIYSGEVPARHARQAAAMVLSDLASDGWHGSYLHLEVHAAGLPGAGAKLEAEHYPEWITRALRDARGPEA